MHEEIVDFVSVSLLWHCTRMFWKMSPGHVACLDGCCAPEPLWVAHCMVSAALLTPDHSLGDGCRQGRSSGSGGHADLHEGGSTSRDCRSKREGCMGVDQVEDSANLKLPCGS